MKNSSINNQSNPQFKARLEVKIGEDCFAQLRGISGGDMIASNLVEGIKFLKRIVPTVGGDKDKFVLESIADTSVKPVLKLSYNEKYKQTVDGDFGVCAMIIKAFENLVSSIIRDSKNDLRTTFDCNLGMEGHLKRLRELNTEN